MIKVNFAQSENLIIIADFEKAYFNDESYSLDMITEMYKDNYILKNNDNILVVLNDEDLIGYIIFHITDDFTDIYKIFVRDHDRNKGYATMLLNKVIELAKRYKSKKLMVEVRSQNKIANNFYTKNNFKNISIREQYYKNPTDDALILERSL